jgi:PAS domain S-box-containing protein
MTHEIYSAAFEADSLYTALFEALPGSCILLQNNAPHYTVLAATPEYLAQTGYRKETIIGKGVFEMSPPNPDDPTDTGARDLRSSLEMVRLHKTSHQLPVQRYDIAGESGSFSERYWRASNTPVFAPRGDIAYIIHEAEDITDQVMAEKREVQIEDIEKAYNLFMQVPAIISVTKGPTHILELANEGAMQLWGKGDDIIGKPLVEAIPEVQGQGIVERFDEVLKTGHPFLAREVPVSACKTGNKEDLYFDVLYTPYYEKGSNTPSGVFSISHEVTELTKARRKIEESEEALKQSEQDLRTMALQAPIGICVLDAATLISEIANDKFLEIAGRPLNEVVGWMYWDTFTEARPYYEEALNKVVQEGITFSASEVEVPLIRHGKKETLHVTFVYEPLKNTEGVVKKVAVWVLDNTPQVVARRKGEESETKFRSLIEEAPVATCLFVGRDMVIEVANEAMIQVWGKGPGVMGKPLAEALPELKGQHFLPLLDELFTTGNTYSSKGGRADLVVDGELETFYFDYDFKPLRNAEGNVYAILETAVDVTKQVLAQQKIEASQRSLLNLFEQSPVGIATLSGDDAFVFETANAFYGALVGRRPEEIIGKPLLQALPELKGQGFDELLKNVISTGNPYLASEVTAKLLRNGLMETIFVNLTYQPRKEGQNVTGVLVVATDVTEQVLARKKVEDKEEALENALEQLRLSKQAAELGTFDMNMKSGFMHWDDRCRLLFGISHQEPVSYERDFIQRLHPDDQERVLGVLSRAFDKTISNGDYDVEYRTIGADDGIVRWVRAKGKLYFDNQQQADRFIGSVLDITDQKTAIQKVESLVEERTKELAQANERLQTINQELQRSNIHLEEFAHAASHDMKEPIRKVLTFTDRIKSSLEPRMTETEKQLFARVENATQRMGLLVDDLLEFSHVSVRPLDKEDVNLNVKLEKVLIDLELEIEEKGATVNVGKLPVVKGYRRQLQQLFQNLVGNALKYSKPSQAPVVTITSKEVFGYEVANKVQQEQAELSFHLIEVQDNGIGFEPKYAEKIFGMFQRLHGKAEYPGTGVGLSIARKVVENHNGYIWAESQPGEGATFKLLLPQ